MGNRKPGSGTCEKIGFTDFGTTHFQCFTQLITGSNSIFSHVPDTVLPDTILPFSRMRRRGGSRPPPTFGKRAVLQRWGGTWDNLPTEGYELRRLVMLPRKRFFREIAGGRGEHLMLPVLEVTMDLPGAPGKEV